MARRCYSANRGSTLFFFLFLFSKLNHEALCRFSCWGRDPLDLDPETRYNGSLAGLPTSRRSRDLAALERLRTWLDDYDFATDNVQD